MVKSRTWRCMPQRAQPVLVRLGKLLAGPVHGLLGERVEAFLVAQHRGLFVVVALYDRAVETAHQVEALTGEGVVAHDVPHADVVRTGLLPGIGKHPLQGVQVRMDVSEDGKAHVGL